MNVPLSCFATAIYRMVLALILVALAGCAERPTAAALLPVDSVPEGSEIIRIYVATNRATDQETGGFETEPSFETTYLYFDISVPPERQPNVVKYRSAPPDMRSQFVITGTGALSRAEFRTLVAQDASKGTQPGVYVHGYNTRFPEALLHLALLKADSRYPGPTVLFSWPSLGHPLGYVADRQSALFSRDALTEVLTDVAARRNTLLFSHSMGGWLSIEALRTLRLEKRTDVLQHLEVVLAAPDIDVMVFDQQMRTIGPLAKPLVVLVARDDKALAVSSMIGTGRPRIGALSVDAPEVQNSARASNVRIIDIGAIQTDTIGHSRYVPLAGLYESLQQNGRGQNELAVAGAYVLNTVATEILRPVTAITGQTQ